MKLSTGPWPRARTCLSSIMASSWGPPKRIAGAFGRKVRRFIASDLNLYAAHLALDLHPTLGNNAELCRLLDLQAVDTYFSFKGKDVGLIAEPAVPVQLR